MHNIMCLLYSDFYIIQNSTNIATKFITSGQLLLALSPSMLTLLSTSSRSLCPYGLDHFSWVLTCQWPGYGTQYQCLARQSLTVATISRSFHQMNHMTFTTKSKSIIIIVSLSYVVRTPWDHNNMQCVLIESNGIY